MGLSLSGFQDRLRTNPTTRPRLVRRKDFVFTTNHIEKLDLALIRRGRMGKHIELSYCKFEAFKVLAKNYFDIESHPLFKKISQLLEEVNMSPADVAENLIPKIEDGDAETCLESLIQALEERRRCTKQRK
jgi:hypothetical protein